MAEIDLQLHTPPPAPKSSAAAMTPAEILIFTKRALSAAGVKIDYEMPYTSPERPVWLLTTKTRDRCLLYPLSGQWSFEGQMGNGLSSLFYHLGLKQPTLPAR